LKNHLIDGIEVRRFRYAPARLEKLTHGEGAPNKLKKNPFLKVLTLTYLLSGIWSVWRICREKRIDILHVHRPFPHGLMALLPAWLARVKILSSCHGAEIALAARNRWSTALLASCLRRSNAVTANSRPDSEKSPRKMRKLYLWDRNAGEFFIPRKAGKLVLLTRFLQTFLE
jgi:hypothetical protein